MINSLNNAGIKQTAELLKKAKARKKEDVFVVEGSRMFREVSPERVVRCYATESFFQKEGNSRQLRDCNCEMVSEEVFRKISDTQTPQGIVCVVKQYHYSLEEILKKENPLLLLLEDLQDPGNLGTIVRTGEAAGIDGVIMTKDTVDIYNPKTIRATMGSIYRVPFFYTEDLHSVIKELKLKGIRTYAAHLEGEEYQQVQDFRNGTAFLIGNEGKGLKKETADLADCYVKIPMEGQVESLNAAIASAILMYQAAMQRRK